MRAVGKKVLIGATLAITVIAAAPYLVSNGIVVGTERIMALPDRMETYSAIDETCSDEQNRSKCLAELLAETEHDLEQTLGAKLKDTWPAFRDSLCKDMSGDELNDCRIYQTRLFQKQRRLYKATKNTGLEEENPIK